ncbi:rod shape-determining protein MreC [Draconibacterium sp. IB214405]|uniref:rod shape-determining protein MreC n=1 Tax=Draconibacterium sp. IB214405 TaxID=3097352 RepID=UPI002A145D53|nr:rod shape-determining protein MreC [Draconibacterium sp. IB214405]MDX8340984.1 rod shape-determining protein MreC [Draconibacterium sp. IB214405]
MRSLLRFLVRNYAFLLFLFLEAVSLAMVFSYNSFQRSRFLNSSNFISASLYNTTSSVLQYFELVKVNEQLAEENALLRTQIEGFDFDGQLLPDTVVFAKQLADTTFVFRTAKIINNSTNKQQNYITLDKGSKDGIQPDQGILAPNGVVGVVTGVSDSYAAGLSLLNPRWSISAKLKNSGYYGSLHWDGENYRQANLNEIPIHVDLAVGDTVVTSGYSSIFPEGLLIGTIQTFDQPQGENYYNIKVQLAVDFKTIRHVHVIENIKKEELTDLEKTVIDGAGSN